MKRGARSAVAVVAAVIVVTGCGGTAEDAASETFTGLPREAQVPGPEHVHGLGYDAQRDVLYVATHTGDDGATW